jgi:hypothetical protein
LRGTPSIPSLQNRFATTFLRNRGKLVSKRNGYVRVVKVLGLSALQRTMYSGEV